MALNPRSPVGAYLRNRGANDDEALISSLMAKFDMPRDRAVGIVAEFRSE